MKTLSEFPYCSVELASLRENILHVKITPPSRTDYVCGLDKYGFIPRHDPDSSKMTEDEDYFSLKTSCAEVKVCKKTGCIRLADARGKILLEQTSLAFKDAKFHASFKTNEGEDYAGFGDVSRERCWHRGQKIRCWITNVKSYITSPFYMSTAGYGLLINSTYLSEFDMGASDPSAIRIMDEGGVFDIYLFIAPKIKGLLSLYTELTGRPKLPPVWSLGLWHICNNVCNSRDVVEEGLHYRDKEVPCDVIGLEPGWMETSYDYTTKKDWSRERFPLMIPSFKFRNRTFVDSLKKGMGFHFELWLCENYDLTYEEERRARRTLKAEEKLERDQEEFDPHLDHPSKFDNITIPEEPWFKHLENFVDFGADFFKLDCAEQGIPHPDRHYGNGMDDDECHNMYCLMLARQMYEGFAQYTKRRPFIFTPCGWTAFQQWSGTWTGDTGGRLGTLSGMFGTSMIGHGLTTCDMSSNEMDGIHFGYLLPLSQINNYSSYKMPWVWGKKILDAHRDYSNLRSRLIPYLYSCMWKASQDGTPMLMPLSLEFEEDLKCRTVRNEYLLGPALMVLVFDNNACFPRGAWKDFWTGKIHAGNTEETVSWPENRGGGLYLREGAILPMGPVMQYRGERKTDEIELYLFPSAEKTSFKYYEDDGITFEYENGRYSVTEITMEKQSGKVVLNIEQGTESIVKTWKIRMALDKAPSKLLAGGKETAFSWDEERKECSAVLPCTGNIIIEL